MAAAKSHRLLALYAVSLVTLQIRCYWSLELIPPTSCWRNKPMRAGCENVLCPAGGSSYMNIYTVNHKN